MFEPDDRIGICSFNFKTSEQVLDPLSGNMYSQVSLWLLPVIEEVFCKDVFREYRIRIERLDIDLGQVLCSDQTLRDMQLHFRNALESELLKRISNHSGNEDANREVITLKQAGVCYIIEYLRFGFFTQKMPSTPQDLLDEILNSDIGQFIEILKKCKEREDAIKRLVWQFDIDSIEKLISKTELSEREFLIDFICQLKKKRSISPGVLEKPFESDVTKYHRQILEFTVHYFLLEKSVQFNRRDFVENIIMKIGAHYNISFTLFVNSLIQSIDMVSAERSGKHELRSILDEISNRYTINNKSEEKNKESFSETSMSFLAALRSDTMHSESLLIWDRMHFLWNEKLQIFMMERCKDTRYVRNIVAVFDRRRLAECITVLCQDGNEFISRFTDAAEDRLPQAIMKIKKYNDAAAPLRQQVLEFIISYLMHRNGGAFNEIEFTRQILGSIAAHHNLHFATLLYAVIRSITDSGESPEHYKTLLLVLGQLKKEHDLPENRSDDFAVYTNDDKTYNAENTFNSSQTDKNITEEKMRSQVNSKSSLEKYHEEDLICNDEIAELFKFLLNPSGCSADQNAGNAVSVINNLIVNYPQILHNKLEYSGDASCVAAAMVPLLSENMFFRLVHNFSIHLGAKAYHCFTSIRSAIQMKFTGDEIRMQTERLMTTLLVLLLKNDMNGMDSEKLFTAIMIQFTNGIPETGRLEFTSAVIDAVEKQGSLSLTSGSAVEKGILTQKILQGRTYSAQTQTDSVIIKEKETAEERKNANLENVPEDLPEEIPVENAGMIIGAPYFERLFNMLGFIDDKKFSDEISKQKAMKLLHYFCRHTTKCHEFMFVLNKVLCGCDITKRPELEIELTEKEKETVDGLVVAIIKNWPKIGGTSAQGLRESFLQRSGILTRNDDGWLLRVDHRSFDMLIDTLPWGFSMVKYPWMKGLLRVEWKWV